MGQRRTYQPSLVALLPLLTSALVLAGCSAAVEPLVVVMGQPPRTFHRTSDGIPYIDQSGQYTARDLDGIVREYARQNGLGFDFGGTSVTFLVRQDQIEGIYSHGIGRPMLTAVIGWDGYVKRHWIGIAAEGRAEMWDDRQEPTTRP